jgi:hypothetical protein
MYPGLPNIVLKRSLYDDRDITREVIINYLKETVGDETIGAGWKSFVFDSAGVDVTLFDLIAAYHRHGQAFAKLPGKSSFSGARPTRDNDALWFSHYGNSFSAGVGCEIQNISATANTGTIPTARQTFIVSITFDYSARLHHQPIGSASSFVSSAPIHHHASSILREYSDQS